MRNINIKTLLLLLLAALLLPLAGCGEEPVIVEDGDCFEKFMDAVCAFDFSTAYYYLSENATSMTTPKPAPTEDVSDGIEIAADAFPSINSFRTTDYGFAEWEYLADLAKVSGWIESAKKDGADAVVCFLHWGFEYNLDADDSQKRFARDLANAGADVIFGSHPHVPQSAEWVTAADGRTVPVYYSIGNFISNQRRETLPSTPNNINT